MEILSYQNGRDYAFILNSLIHEKWSAYYNEKAEEYRWALESSYTYVAYVDDNYAGYIRAISDGVFTVMICEIIVDEKYRNKGIARELIREVRNKFKGARIELLCDTPEIYEHMGFSKVGYGMRK
ncbi:MAG: GNAT family N-acetyltransferase [Erysipelotrichales bacterium]|nr:GNAT family N-acetyltransferase [Erysipelotrichales bacterium]